MLPPLPPVAVGVFALLLSTCMVPFVLHVLMIRGGGWYREKPLRQKGVMVAILVGYLVAGALLTAWAAATRPTTAGLIWTGLYFFSVFTFLSYVYFHVFNLSETARRIRILAESRRTGRLERDSIIETYSCSHMVAIRVDRLVALVELRTDGNRYRRGRGILLLPARLVFRFGRVLFPDRGA